MTDPLVTIIIPCYQQGHFLGEAVDSALAQTYANLEIIIIDDGSTDTTREVAQAYQDRHAGRVRLIGQANQGQARARQRGLEAATGEYLVLLDADDRLEPMMVERCLAAFARNPSAAVMVGDAWLIDGQGKRLRAWPQRRIVLWPRILVNNPYGALASIMTRATVVRQVGGLATPGTPGSEDWDLWARLARTRQTFVSLGVAVGCYRQTGASYSHQPLRMLRSMLELLDRCRNDDPRLAGRDGRLPALPSISKRTFNILCNGKVFKALGLAVAGGAEPATIRAILEHLTAGPLSVRYCGDHFLEGLHYGGAWREGAVTVGEEQIKSLNEALNERLRAQGLGRRERVLWPKLRQSLLQPGRKRSLACRLAERFDFFQRIYP